MNYLNIVLCGGSGSRLWPISNESKPKQFSQIFSHSGEMIKDDSHYNDSLIAQTISRNKNIFGYDTKTILVSNIMYFNNICNSITNFNIKNFNFILENDSKNTAASLTAASLLAIKKYDDPVLVVTPADHIIEEQDKYRRILLKAIKKSSKSNIACLFGVKTLYPSTEFGYIKSSNQNRSGVVKGFYEKPSLNTAKKYHSDDSFFWNSGIFVMKASFWLKWFSSFENFNFLNIEKSLDLSDLNKYVFLLDNNFKKVKSNSIDKSVIEKIPSEKLYVYNLDAKWDDIGSVDSFSKRNSDFKSFQQLISNDSSNNTILSNNKNNFYVLNGIKNTNILNFDNIYLLSNKSKDTSSIKDLYESYKKYRTHINQFFRPWGMFINLAQGHNFKVKHLIINPKFGISYQFHKKRIEHWVIINGTAEVTINGNLKILKKGESISILQKDRHKVFNNSKKIKLEIIETQYGSYLEEDDIVRLDDPYFLYRDFE